MKSNILVLSSVLAVIAALIVLLPVGALATGGNALVALGILAVFAADYGRALQPVRLPSRRLV
jgi:hypothetical protein